MMTVILVPRDMLNDGDVAVIGSWLYADGDRVPAGAAVAELMVEKSSYQVEAPCSGILRISVQEEAEVQPGDEIGRITPE